MRCQAARGYKAISGRDNDHDNHSVTITNPEPSNKQTITSTIDNSQVPHTSKTTISNANTNETMDDLTETLIMEIMRDDDRDMGTDPAKERSLLSLIDNNQDSHIEPQTNHLTQESSDSTGLEGVTQKTPEIIQLPSTNPINLHANQTREIMA